VSVPTPSLTLTVTAPGGSPVDYTQYLAWSGAAGPAYAVTQNFGRQGDTGTLILVDEFYSTPNVLVVPMSQVRLYDNIAGEVIFAGVVTDPEMLVDGPARREWTLNCVDYALYADDAMVHGTFYGESVDQIVIALTLQANKGISAVSTANGGFVAPGPVLASVVLNYKSLTDAWRQLAQLAGQSTPYGWYVDDQRRLHFYDATTAISSGVTVTTTPTAAGAGSTTEAHFTGGGQDFSYAWDGGSIRNRVLVQGATQTVISPTTGPATDTFRADGVATSWPLRYALTGNPLVVVNGAIQNVTVATGGVTASGAWVAQQNAVGTWFLLAANPPGTGTKIQIWYNYQVPIVARANDYTSQSFYTGPNGGVFEIYISDSSLTTASMALARAMRERTEYSYAVEKITFSTTPEFMGYVRAGQTILVTNQWIPDSRNSYALGVTNATFLVVSNDVSSSSDGGYRTMAITAVRL
jgi:hypothetical protein